MCSLKKSYSPLFIAIFTLISQIIYITQISARFNRSDPDSFTKAQCDWEAHLQKELLEYALSKEESRFEQIHPAQKKCLELGAKKCGGITVEVEDVSQDENPSGFKYVFTIRKGAEGLVESYIGGEHTWVYECKKIDEEDYQQERLILELETGTCRWHFHANQYLADWVSHESWDEHTYLKIEYPTLKQAMKACFKVGSSRCGGVICFF